MKRTHEIIALNFPALSERQDYRIEKGKTDRTGLTPTSMIDKGHSVLVTFKATDHCVYERYNEGDTVQREYMKGQLENIEKIKREEVEE